jgi:hypothetical protein
MMPAVEPPCTPAVAATAIEFVDQRARANMDPLCVCIAIPGTSSSASAGTQPASIVATSTDAIYVSAGTNVPVVDVSSQAAIAVHGAATIATSPGRVASVPSAAAVAVAAA